MTRGIQIHINGNEVARAIEEGMWSGGAVYLAGIGSSSPSEAVRKGIVMAVSTIFPFAYAAGKRITEAGFRRNTPLRVRPRRTR